SAGKCPADGPPSKDRASDPIQNEVTYVRARAVERLSSVLFIATLAASGFLLSLNASPCLAVPQVYTIEGDPDVPGVSVQKLPDQTGSSRPSTGRGNEEANPPAQEVRQVAAPSS